MDFTGARQPRTHGTGDVDRSAFARLGPDVVIENGVLVFHPETLEIGAGVYIGHNAILKGYYRSRFVIGDYTWIGQGAFLHSAGGLRIGRAVGIGPMVKVLTSTHQDGPLETPVVFQSLEFSEVVLEDGCDLGIGTIVLPGVTIGEGAIIGAGSVVTQAVPAYEVWAGVPARKLRSRHEPKGERPEYTE
jgi:acetyltransferase-like isoleucine patch superfamily enzyme